MGHYTTRSHDAVLPDVYTWCNHAIGAYPDIVLDDHLGCNHLLLVKPPIWVAEAMVQARHHDALRKVDMATYMYGTDDCVVKAHATMVTHDDVAYGIVYAGITLYHTLLAQTKGMKGYYIHTRRTINDTTPGASGIERLEQT